MTQKRSKRWCFTLNNYTEDDEHNLQIMYDEGKCEYLIVGREVGESGTPHLQGYVEFRDRVGLRKAKEFCGSTAHLEVSRGTPGEAAGYCKKDGDFWEMGQMAPGQGHRADLESVRKSIRAGVPEADIADAAFPLWCQYRRSFSAYRSLLAQPRNWVTQVFVLVGLTGTGKSRLVHQCSRALWVAPDNAGKWCDGWDPSVHRDALYDDFDGRGAELGCFLRLLDRYPLSVPVKGGFVEWNPRRVFFTSNVPLDGWHWNSSSPEQLDALRRRVTNVWWLPKPLVFDDKGVPLEEEGSEQSFKILYE